MTPAPRLLITGASGTLGGPLAVQAAAAGWDVTATYLTRADRVRAGKPVRLDLRDAGAVDALVRQVQPDVIIHAAVTERSGDGYADAIRLAGRHIARAAGTVGARLIALSTDLVFDGSQPLYTEETPVQPSPHGIYGQAKADAERAILAIDPAGLVVRTSLIYDFDPANAQVAWMLRAIERGEPVRLYADQIRCPIWAVDLADALITLAATDARGLLHVVGPQALSRYDLGTALLRALGHDPTQHVIAAESPETQPRRLVLSVERAQALLGRPLLTLAQVVANN